MTALQIENSDVTAKYAAKIIGFALLVWYLYEGGG